MAEDWAAIAAEVAEALGEFMEVTFHQPATDGSFDPATDTTTGASPAQTHLGSGFEGEFSGFSIVSGAVEARDIRFFAASLKRDGQPLPLPVADLWTVTLNGVNHTIKRVGATRPAGTSVLYDLHLRG